jgi:hypothetical protein
MAPNLCVGSGCSGWSSSKAHLPTWARFRARTGSPPGIRPVMRDDQRRAGRPRLGFLSPFGCRHSLLGHPVPPVELVHRYLRLTATLHGVADPDGVSVFRTHETRLGLGAPCTPRTVVSTRPHTILGRHLPPSNGRPLSPWHRSPSQDVQLTRHQRGFTGIHPAPSLPLACGPRTEREPLGLSRELRTRPLLAAAVTHVTVGTGLGH